MKIRASLGILVLSVLFVFNISKPDADGNWARKANMPTPRFSLSAGVVDGKIYAIGGAGIRLLIEKKPWRLKTVEVYNLATDTWGKSRSLNHARDGLTTSVVDGEIHAIGGTGWPQIANHPGPFPASVEVLNPQTPRNWREKTDMLAPRAGHTASVIDGKIYVVGGGSGAMDRLCISRRLKFTIRSWTRGPKPLICRLAARSIRLRS